jgi:hypothetical protein
MAQESTAQGATKHKVRIWDLPTRLFHWLLAATVVGLVVTAKLGGNAMNWHLLLGHAMLALLLFRLQARLQADFDRPVELMELFRRTTVPAMAQWLGGAEPEPAPVVSRQSIEDISRRLARQRQRVRGGAREESPA